MLEFLKRRIEELRQAEGMAWANLHAIQGRLAEVEHLLEYLQDDTPAVPLADILPEGFREDTGGL